MKVYTVTPKRRSKYIGVKYGDWTVIDKQVAYASKRYNNNYRYILMRPTSDKKANKILIVNSTQMAKIGRGLVTPETLLDNREVNNRKETKFNKYVMYHFADL